LLLQNTSLFAAGGGRISVMDTILVPVDFSTGSRRLVRAAADLGRSLHGQLVLLHVAEPVAAYVPVGASMDVIAPPPVDLLEYETPALAERLEGLAALVRDNVLPVECVVVTGLATEEILEQAVVRQARYIVMASHGHGALFHLFSGSVVTGVLRRARQPVLIVPVREKE
jgi:nucleotide-binding universal stress UspA family protein